MKIAITRNAFAAAVHCAATENVRYYLNGACLRITDGEKGQLYSTDGHVLFVCRFDIVSEDISDCSGTFDIIIPLDALKHAAKKKPGKYVSIQSMDNGQYLIDGLAFTPIDGTYPDVARVIPDANSFNHDNKPGQFNPELLLRCQKSLRAWYGERHGNYRLFHNGDHCSAIMQGSDNTALCVNMPILLENVNEKPYSFTVTSRS